MSFLLDTNVVSEWVKSHPNAGVIKWLTKIDEEQIFISVVTLVELYYGIGRMPAGARRNKLKDWVANELLPRFEGRLLGIDANIAENWGQFMVRMQSAGHSIELMDACLAAIAKHYELTLVTRNIPDFEMLGIKLINPWTKT